VVTEGLIIYLSPEHVASLARDLRAVPSIHTWITDLASPGLVKMMSERGGDMIKAAGAPFVFAPPEGPDFFTPLGWKTVEAASLLKTGDRLKRLPFFLRLIAKLPEPKTRDPNRPWSAVVHFDRAGA